MARPLSLGSIIPETLKEFGLEKKASNYAVITGWEEIVGEKVAGITEVEKLERGVLTVRVLSTVWRYELTLRSQEILRKIGTLHGHGLVNEIRWKI
jgi:predicted nucleic acid-binding Zn ribbon protein